MPPSTPSPFTLFHQALNASTGALGTNPSTAHSFLTKLGYLPGIEECLRLFTAVEVLDGENMVGCHRCWKIANGTYQPRRSGDALREDEENGSDENVEDLPIGVQGLVDVAPTSSAESSPDLAKLSPASTPVMSTKTSPSSLFLSENASTMSAPTTMSSISPQPETSILLPSQPDSQSFGGLPIPSISTTAPESPMTSPMANGTPTVPTDSSDCVPCKSPADSLLPPKTKRSRKAGSSKKTDDSSDSSDDDFDSTSDASGAYSDASSAASSVASPTLSPRTSLNKLRSDRPDIPRSHSAESSLAVKSNVPRSQQVIMRRMYKRYLVATPPPILVVHLKRFQQASKMPVMSFSAGFKKMDEFVAFPEYLDLSPYLAPRKEDFGLGKASKEKSKRRSMIKAKDDKCMYRLYAVVVHIGNMVCASQFWM